MTKDLSIIVKTVARNDLIGGIVLFLILLLLQTPNLPKKKVEKQENFNKNVKLEEYY